jgi:hypothetical protein
MADYPNHLHDFESSKYYVGEKKLFIYIEVVKTYLISLIITFLMGLTAGVTGRWGMLTPRRHLDWVAQNLG